MSTLFYLSSIVAVFATTMMITRLNPVHALLYLVVSFLSVALMFFTVGAPFIAALEVIVYAGAIIVLFIFVMMLVNLGPESAKQERQWLNGSIWIGPSILSLILLIELIVMINQHQALAPKGEIVPIKEIGIMLFGPYMLGVELAAMLLLAGLVGAYHLGKPEEPNKAGEES